VSRKFAAAASKRLIAFSLLSLCTAFTARAGQLPELPRLTFDAFRPGSRDPIERAYARATANPNDAPAVGVRAWRCPKPCG
jgi:uncharacterized protein YbjT (DUF2867 family)